MAALNKELDPRFAKVFAVIAGAIGFLVIYFFFASLGKLVPAHSDSSYLILYADAILKGNPMLQGWNLTSVGYYTELPFYVVGVKAMGVHPDLMRLVPAAIYAFNIALSLLVVWKYRIGTGRIKYLPIIVFLVLPSTGIWPYALTGAIHMVTLMAGLVLFLLLNDDLIVSSRRTSVLITLLTAIAMWADLAFLFFFIIPTFVAGVLRWWPDKASMRSFCVSTMVPLLLGSIIGYLWIVLFKVLGFGVAVQVYETAFETPKAASAKLNHLSHTWLQFFGGDFWGRNLNIESLSIFLLGLSVVWWLLSFIGSFQRRDSGFDLLLATMLPLVAAAVVLTTKEATGGGRFLVPAFIAAVLLMSRDIQRPSVHNARQHFGVLVAVAAVVVSGSFIARHRVLLAGDAYASDFRSAADALRKRGLRFGFGEYWASHATLVASGGYLSIVPIDFSEDYVYVFPWAADRKWFSRTNGRFVVLHGLLASNLEDHMFVNLAGKSASTTKRASLKARTYYEESAMQVWGPPAERLEFGNLLVLIWSEDISIDGAQPTPNLRHLGPPN